MKRLFSGLVAIAMSITPVVLGAIEGSGWQTHTPPPPTRTVYRVFVQEGAVGAGASIAEATPSPTAQTPKPPTPAAHIAPPPATRRAVKAPPLTQLTTPNAEAGTPHNDPDASDNDTDAVQAYIRANYADIQHRVKERLVYPMQARRAGIHGTTTVAFTIERGGNVEVANVRESSGYALLDRAALDAVKRAAPFSLPPRRMRMAMAVIFTLRR
jgi:protein TonB